jgi:hypothetical protein
MMQHYVGLKNLLQEGAQMQALAVVTRTSGKPVSAYVMQRYYKTAALCTYVKRW